VHATSITTAAKATVTMEGNLGQRLDVLPDAIAARVEAPLNAAACEKEAAECRELGQRYRAEMRKCYENDDEGRDELTAIGSSFMHIKRRSPDDDDLTVLEQLYMEEAAPDEEMGEMSSAWIRRFRSLVAKGYDHGLPTDRHNIHAPSQTSPVTPICTAFTIVSPSTAATVPGSADTSSTAPDDMGQQLSAKIDGLVHAFESTLALSSSQPHEDKLHEILQEGLSLVRSGAEVVRQRSVAPPPEAGTVVPAGGKRKRSADCTGLPHQTLTECKDIAGLWDEYVGADGQGGLRRRQRLTPKWAGEGDVNKSNRDLFTEKKFIYREIAKQARDLRSVPLALQAVQERLDGFKKKATGGWGNKKAGLLAVLRSEQPEGEVRNGLTSLLSDMDTSR